MILYLEQFNDDWVIMSNIYYLLDTKKYGNQVRSLESCKGEVFDDPIAICGHGMPGRIGEYNAGQLMTFLEGVKQPINLFSCYAGAKTLTNPESLVESLNRCLKVPVTGKVGSALTSISIGERVVRLDKDDEYYPNVQYPVLSRHEFPYATNNGRVNLSVSTIWPDLAKCNIEAKAREVGVRTRECYIKLVQEAEKLGCLFPPTQGIITAGA